jgi:hypothetical protein
MGLMADYFQSQPNFVNPAYATPEQLATQRAYAAELSKRSGETVNRPTGALANMITALTAGLTRNNADRLQSEAAAHNAQDFQTLISQLKGGSQAQPMPYAPSAAISSAPSSGPSPSEVASARSEVMPSNKVWGDKEAESAGLYEPTKVASLGPAGGPGGGQAPVAGTPAAAGPAPSMPQQPPVQMAGGLDPAVMARVLANPMASPEQRALITLLIQPEAGKDVYNKPYYSSPLAPAGGQPQFGIAAPVQAGEVGTTQIISPPGSNAAPPTSNIPGFNGSSSSGLNSPSGIDALAAKGRELAAAKTLTQAGATAQGEGNQEDVRSATAAPAIIKGLGLIKSTIQASPDITFGPTAKWSAEAKRVIANYAPGLTDEKSLAGADAIEKLNFGLATQLAKTAGGTQGELFKAIGATPGTEKSKQGTLALIDMIQQDQMKAQQLGALYRQYEAGGKLQDYPAAREQFLTQHPTTNPLTGRPIEMDIKATREAASAAPANGPAVGTTHNGYRFKGGNPNDKSSWEKL